MHKHTNATENSAHVTAIGVCNNVSEDAELMVFVVRNLVLHK